MTVSDVTALLLTIGEPYAERARASVARQAPAVAGTVTVHGTVPFHRALNEGAARVQTDFFVQVDADMVLDDTCVAGLRAAMADGAGIVVGHLRDPLRGRAVGIKLFRTRCFERFRFPDSPSPDTDFGERIAHAGWTTVYALRHASDHTFGEHRPDYSPLYTFSKFRIEGCRLRYRKTWRGARYLLRRLLESPHPMARIAVIAAAHGLLVEADGDPLRPFPASEELVLLEHFLAAPVTALPPAEAPRCGLREVFRHGYALGVRLRQQRDPAPFLARLKALAGADGVEPWVAAIAACHGLFQPSYSEAGADAAFRLLRDLLPDHAAGPR